MSTIKKATKGSNQRKPQLHAAAPPNLDSMEVLPAVGDRPRPVAPRWVGSAASLIYRMEWPVRLLHFFPSNLMV